MEGKQAAAGWPSWLSAVAAEAVQGWVPLSAESFEKLEKVGQGIYSIVLRARELAIGCLVALKKVRFDRVEPSDIGLAVAGSGPPNAGGGKTRGVATTCRRRACTPGSLLHGRPGLA